MALATTTSDCLLNPVDLLSHFMKRFPGLSFQVKKMGKYRLLSHWSRAAHSCP